MIQVVYGAERYAESFRHAADTVARERIYIEMIEAFPLEDTRDFIKKTTINDWPIYFAIDTAKDEVVGWCDIVPPSNPRLAHRGSLGMGLVPKARGQGLGKLLLHEALEHARRRGFEKVELLVYTTNVSAIGLYRKFGFAETGLTKNYRKLDGVYYDCLHMEKFL
jgi:ribosomal protein S18 acetylase RimI-like enzyme